MRRNSAGWLRLITATLILFNSACAQDSSRLGKEYVKEQEQVAKSTVLFNNEKFLVPLQNLETLKIASVHFSNVYANDFDSLLNKYSKIQSFNGREYIRTKNINALDGDLKLFNTIIIQLTEEDLKNPQIISFVISSQALKNVIVAYNGKGSDLVKLNDITGPLVWTEKKSSVAAMYAAQAIFGGVAISGKSPA